MSALEDTILWQIKMAGLPEPRREFLAIPGRRFRYDLAWEDFNLLVEVQGGTWSRGKQGHNSGSGINRDCEKFNLAILNGWRVLLVDAKHIRQTGEALRWIQQALDV